MFVISVTLFLSTVSPLLMLVFVTLAVDSDTPNKWLSAVGIARIFRKVFLLYYNFTSSSQCIL